MKLLCGTNDTLLNISLLLLRLTIGIPLFYVGAGKVLGVFGGMGLEATINMFETHMAIPAFLAYLSCFTEFIGGALIAIGLLTRPAAVAMTINMVVATIFVLPNGFFVPNGTGAEYPTTLAVISLIILLAGPMGYSLDALLLCKRTKS